MHRQLVVKFQNCMLEVLHETRRVQTCSTASLLHQKSITSPNETFFTVFNADANMHYTSFQLPAYCFPLELWTKLRHRESENLGLASNAIIDDDVICWRILFCDNFDDFLRYHPSSHGSNVVQLAMLRTCA